MPRGGARKGAGRKRTKPQKPRVTRDAAKPAAVAPPSVESTPEASVNLAATVNPLLVACTRKEQAFLLNLIADPEGNQTRAYERAGFKARGDSARANAAKCLAKDRVRAAFESLHRAILEGKQSKAIADATERREFLTLMQRDTAAHPFVRLKATDLHNKMDGVYIEKHEHKHEIPGSIAFVIQQQPGAENRT